MNNLIFNDTYWYSNYKDIFLEDIKNNINLSLENNKYGKFSISDKKIKKSVLSNNLFENYISCSDEPELFYNYKYKTRFSRQDKNNIKIDEYTLKRKIVEKSNEYNPNKNIYKYDENEIIYKKNIYVNKYKNFSDMYKEEKERNNENILIENNYNDIINEKINKNRFMESTISDITSSYLLNSYTEKNRKIDKNPYCILSAPKFIDDFYLNLLDWSIQNVIAVGLENRVCLWYDNTGKAEELFTLSPIKIKNKQKCKKKFITSLKWNKQGNYLAVGISNGVVEIRDIYKGIKIRKYKNHKLRVGTLSWNNDILTSGSKDSSIINSDIRCKENYFLILKNHTSEVCGLEWSIDGNKLASGSNDNSIYIYDKNFFNNYLYHFNEHKGTVKALSWSPHKNNLLISGGGSADKNICFWNISNGKCTNKIYTHYQVCNLLWSKNTEEFVSTHSSLHNQIILWSYPKLKKLSILSGHKLRVLNLSLSPDGSTIISGSADQTIRFWKIFPKSQSDHIIYPFKNYYELIR